MRSSVIAIILAALVFGGAYYVYHHHAPATESTGSSDTLTETPGPASETQGSSASNYDECIAEGNKPLKDAPDKCLTTDGHLFIKGVVEE